MLFLYVYTVADPAGAATAYGIPLSSLGDIHCMYTKAGRDLGVGVALTALLLARERRALGVFVLAATLMPLADFLIVTSQTGRLMFALGVHGSAAVYTFLLGLALLRRSRIRSYSHPPSGIAAINAIGPMWPKDFHYPPGWGPGMSDHF
jgi:hypothetical protein